MKIRIPKLTAEYFYISFLALFWGRDILFSYARAILLRIPYISYLADYIIPCLMLACILLALPYFAKALLPADLLFTVITATIFMLHLLIFPKNEELLSLAGTFWISVFPLYFVGLGLNTTKHIRTLYIMSLINIWVFAAYYLFIGGSSFEEAHDAYGSYMGRAYVLLPQLMLVIYGFLRKKTPLNIITGILGIVLLLMFGNRGSVLLLLLFLLLYFLFNTAGKKRGYVYVGAASAFGLLAYFYEIISVFFGALFPRLGMSVRIFERIADGTFFESQGRNVILKKLQIAILENPFWGNGLCSDRTISGSYAHNYAYELWTAFGVILGTLILAATIAVILRGWRKSEDQESRGILLLLFCVGFLKLFISSSFLHEGNFFMLLGYCVTRSRSK